MTEWTIGEILELPQHYPVWLVSDVKSNRTVCHRLRRKGSSLYAAEAKTFKHLSGVEHGDLVYADESKHSFRIRPVEGSPLYEALKQCGYIK